MPVVSRPTRPARSSRRRAVAAAAFATAVVAPAVVAVGDGAVPASDFGATPGTASSGPDGAASLVFDWPLDCPVRVAQHYHDPSLAVAVVYDVTVEDAGVDGGVAAVEFGDAVVTSVTGAADVTSATDHGVGDDVGRRLATFFTNPTIEVDSDGAPVEAVGFEEWFETFAEADQGAASSEAGLERDITHRAIAVLWDTWAGLWLTPPELPDGLTELDDVAYVDEYLDEQRADLVVVRETASDGDVTLLAERAVEGDALEQLLRSGTDPATGDPVVLDPTLGQRRITSFELTADAATLVPSTASYEVRLVDEAGADDLIVAYDWTFDWPRCDDGPSTADIATTLPTLPTATTEPRSAPTSDDGQAAPPGLAAVAVEELPPEVLATLELIDADGPFPYARDGVVFENRERLLPDEPLGYYREYTVETPGSDDRGARRIVTGSGGEVYYTADHYATFVFVVR